MHAGSFTNASVGPYRLVDFLGAGGMGEVYRGIHESLGRVVAIKILATSGSAAMLEERFLNEANIQSGLAHPNIVALYDFLSIGGRPCIVMEYVDGPTLDQRLRQTGPIPPAEALELLRAATDGVAYLHDRGIVHRDLKCSNIKLTEDGRLKLLDFGLAKGHRTPKFTATGLVVGTLEYMAPEQLGSQPIDGRADLWALGVIFYEMVTGRLPFSARDPIELVGLVSRAKFFPASTISPNVPPAVDRIIEACLQPDPDARVGSAAALGEMVRGAQSRGNPPTPSRSHSPWGRVRDTLRHPRRLALGAIGLLLVGALAFSIRQAGGGGFELATPPPDTLPVVAEVPPAVVDRLQCGLANGGVGDRMRTVTVSMADGVAEVYCGSLRLGSTPFDLKVEVGRPVSITLRRTGFRDQLISFTPTASTTGFLVTMQPSISRGAEPEPRIMLAFAAWLPFGFGRKRKGNSASVKATRIGDVAAEKETGFGDAATLGLTRVQASVLSDVGCVREANEDAIAYCRPTEPDALEEKGTLLVAADGMGGHSAGEVASRLAVETLIEQYGEDNGDPQAALTRAVLSANRTIREVAAADAAHAGMGTTCTALVVRQGWAYCSHVGDSRLYLVRDGAILQMTEDDSAVFDLVKRGVIDRDAARQHPDRNVIVRALGSRPDLEVAEWNRPLFVRQSDRFIASTDGLHDLLSDDELCENVLAYDPETACRLLVGLARERGGHDNISVGILAILPEDDQLTIPISTDLAEPGGEQ